MYCKEIGNLYCMLTVSMCVNLSIVSYNQLNYLKPRRIQNVPKIKLKYLFKKLEINFKTQQIWNVHIFYNLTVTQLRILDYKICIELHANWKYWCHVHDPAPSTHLSINLSLFAISGCPLIITQCTVLPQLLQLIHQRYNVYLLSRRVLPDFLYA